MHRVLFRHLHTAQKPLLLGPPPLRKHQRGPHPAVKTRAFGTGTPGSAAVTGFASSSVFSSAFALWSAAAAAATVVAGGAVTYLQRPARLEGLKILDEDLKAKQYPAWVYELAGSMVETPMLTSNTLLSEEHPMLKRDHMVCTQSMAFLIAFCVLDLAVLHPHHHSM